jgi:transposase InsO family protein
VKSAVLHAIALAHYAIFKHNPTALSVQYFLERAVDDARTTPKYIISDKGQQFWCDLFKDWCDRRGITPRFGAVGQHGSIAVVERFILTLKKECTRFILVPLRSKTFRQELALFADWYAEDRPHSGRRELRRYHSTRCALSWGSEALASYRIKARSIAYPLR